MYETKEIEALFAPSTEEKNKKSDQDEKNDRRYEALSRYAPEVMVKVYELNKGIPYAIHVINQKYVSILNSDDLEKAIKEFKTFYNIISKDDADITYISTKIFESDFNEYKKLLKICGFKKYIKSVSRLENIKKKTAVFMNGEISYDAFLDELNNQKAFFGDLISKYSDISVDNFYAYLLRHDLKTVNRKIIKL